jgi:HEAT repeat protein
MDQTLRSILKILEEGKPELKIAACQVLGELRPGDGAAARALADRLTNQEAFLTPFVLEALAQIGTPEAVRVLVSKLRVGGAVTDRVARLLSQMGAQVTKALLPLFDEGDPETQARILAILGRHNDREALTILRKALLQGEPALSERAAEVIESHIEELDPKQAEILQQGIAKALEAKTSSNLDPAVLARAVRVLGRLDGEAHRGLLLRFATPKHAPIVRLAALRALDGVTLTAAQRRTLLAYVTEEDMTHVVRPTMQLLAGADEWDGSATAQLEKMLESRNEERRLFALRALRNRRTEAMARVSIKALLSGAPEFQEAARDALPRNPAALEGLLRAFQTEKNVERARLLARPLAALGKRLSDSQRAALVEKTGKLLAGGDPFGDVYLTLLVEIDRQRAISDLVDKATRLRRARKFSECLAILARLAQTDHIDGDGRYQLAVTRLLMDAREGKSGERKEPGDATMGYFSGLIRDGFPLFDRLRKESQLSPDDLFKVARHFATGVSVERRFGGELLHFVAQKHARRRVGEEAKTMLRVEGL